MTRSLSLAIPTFTLVAIIMGLTTNCVYADLFTESIDAGDSIATSIAVGDGIDAIRGSQFTADSDLVDFFTISYATDVNFTMSNLIWDVTNPTNASIRLYDSGGTQINFLGNVFFFHANNGDEMLSRNLDAGTYFIEVHNSLGTEANKQLGGYEFSITSTFSAVPEPSSFMILGLFGLAGFTTRRKR